MNILKIKKESIKLDWYKDYGIEVIDSVRKDERYSDGQVVPHYVFAFVVAWTEEMVEDFIQLYPIEKIVNFLTVLEKLFLFNPPDCAKYIKAEGGMAKTKILNGRIDDELEMLQKKIKYGENRWFEKQNNFKIIYQSRRPWHIRIYNQCERCGHTGKGVLPNDIKAVLYGRFNFAIIGKNAERIINI